MIRAAGILFLTPDNKCLFLQRGPGGDHPNEWCFPGGQTEAEETAEQTATREALEEVGVMPQGSRTLLTRSVSQPVVGMEPAQEPVDFSTFLQKIDARFEPTISDESVGFAWAPVDQPPEPLHPGCRIALKRLNWHELDVARAMAAGELTSPQRYINVTLFDIRITGTGVAYRGAFRKDGKIVRREEYVFRDPAIFLNDDFVQRCNGLTVILIHPEKALLDSKEFGDRTIGSILLPYVKGDEVWGIAKIYDDDAINLMTYGESSTSPGVLIGSEADQRITLADGKPVLIEGSPKLIDHLAVLPNAPGVWDKKLGLKGVVSSEVRADKEICEVCVVVPNKLDIAIGKMRDMQFRNRIAELIAR